MKKYKKWVGLVMILIGAFIIYSSHNGVSANSTCTQEKAESYYQVTGNYDEDNHLIKITAKHGVFSVVFEGSITGTYTLTAGTPLEISYDSSQPVTATATATLTEGDTVCDVDSKNSVKFSLNFELGVKDELVTNEQYNGLCKKFRDEISAKGADAVAFMQKALSYCYSENVVANYNDKNLESMIDNAKTAWELTLNPVEQGDLSVPEGFTKVDSPDISGVLKCDPWSKTDNVKKYSYSREMVSNDVCTTTCKEDLTLIYGPPVSTTAGLCFTYTVEVKSKVTCSTKVTASPPTMPEICNIYPRCNSFSGFTEQAGPNEDFDACVATCDNGKYTQNCINKCYKKVYGLNTALMMKNINQESEATQVASKCPSKTSDNYEAVYNYIKNHGTGQYEGTYKSVKWNPGNSGCYWDNYSSYYFKDKNLSGRTVYNDINNKRNWYDPRYGRWFYAATSLGYYIPRDGFKAAQRCNEHCRWLGATKGCALNEKEAYDEYQKKLNDYNQKLKKCSSYAKCEEKTSTFSMSVLPSTSDAEWVVYSASNKPTESTDKNLKPSDPPTGDSIIQEQSGVCYGKKDTEGNDYRTKMNFPGVWVKNKDGEVVTERPPKDEEIYYEAKPNQFCAPLNAKNVNEKWWVWDRNLKEYSSSEKAQIEKNIKYNIKASIGNTIDSKGSFVHEKNGGFGLFGWKFNIECFYAIYNGETDYTESETIENDPNLNCDLGDENCVTTDITNYRYKPVALDDLFSGEKETTNAQETGRETGWNWSCAATDLSDPNYPVAPTALTTDIQTKSESIYEDDSKYLDYSIELTTADIISIQHENDHLSTFLNYSGNQYTAKSNEKGIRSVYKSKLLDDLQNKGVVKVRYRETIGCNNQEGRTCITTSRITEDDCVASYKALMNK